jgi:hypothetical protein
MKCEVLENTVIAVGKGSIVDVSVRQYELARRVLKPIKEETAKPAPEDLKEASGEVIKRAKTTKKKK